MLIWVNGTTAVPIIYQLQSALVIIKYISVSRTFSNVLQKVCCA